MARANRHHIPGGLWHITHRCHKKEFLLKFARDRQRLVAWMQEARHRFGFQILNYAVTSNHVHLLVKNTEDTQNIPSAIQLIAGRTAQEYNQRKRRKGAFWEDRYHATAVESGEHLRRCLVYIDLNMVRAGVASHPEEWAHGGYHEIQGKRRRNTVLALDALAEATEVSSSASLAKAHREWVEDALRSGPQKRDDAWTKSIAVGSREFVTETRNALESKGKGREIVDVGAAFVLREAEETYSADFNPENRAIASENGYFWT